MEEVGTQMIVAAAAAAAFAITGCSLFLLSYVIRDKVRAVEFSMKPSTTSTDRFISSATKGCSSAVKRPRKQLRLLQANDEQNKPEKATTPVQKSNPKRDDQIIVGHCRGERKRRGNLPQNWRNLYNGINRYRSQQATLMMYA